MATFTTRSNNQHDLWVVSALSGIKPSIHELVPLVAKQLEFNLKTEWSTIRLETMLNTLMDCDIPVTMVIKYHLDRLVRVVRKKATQDRNKPIADLSAKLMEKWQRLLTEGYSTSKKQSTVNLRLTTDKDYASSSSAAAAITKPKTAANKTFFELSNAPSFFSRTTTSTRPLFTGPYHQQRQQTHIDMAAFLDQLQQNKTASTKNTKSKRPTTAISKPKPRHVRFKSNHELVTVREYHYDDTCSEGGGNHLQQQNPLIIQHHSSHSSQQLSSWYPPRLIQIPDSCRRPCQEKVTPIHDIFTSTALATPSEPDEINYNNNDNNSDIKIIPLFEIDTAYDAHQ